jgi:hypothetical protein
MVTYWAGGRRLEDLLFDLPQGCDRILLCPPYPETAEQLRYYLRDGAMLAGWGFVVRSAHANGRCEATFTHPDGRRVRCTSAAAWFGPEGDERSIAATLKQAARQINKTFRRDRPLPLVTPATCGMALWREEAGGRYPELTEEEQSLVRSTTGQGRQQVLTPPDCGRITTFGYWDMRLAYPSCMEHLPVGPARRDNDPVIPAVGRVLGRFRIPEDWRHVGILPAKTPFLGLDWPDQPGLEGESWCDASEARLAQQHGWAVQVLERLVLQEGAPLDGWRRRLVKLYLQAEHDGDRLLKLAYRSILNHTAADFMGRGRTTPAMVRQVGNGAVEHPVMGPRRTERETHPEWSAAIWARCRRRLTNSLLSVPREALLGCYVDEVYLAETPPWSRLDADPDHIGHMRCKGVLVGDLAPPRTMNELWELKRTAATAAEEFPYDALPDDDHA